MKNHVWHVSAQRPIFLSAQTATWLKILLGLKFLKILKIQILKILQIRLLGLKFLKSLKFIFMKNKIIIKIIVSLSGLSGLGG
jgi:hypothetical protein